jgi:hypothetical protein
MQHPGVPPSAQPPPVFSLPTTASGMPSLPSSPGPAAGPRAVPAASPNRATSFRAPEGEPASEPDNALVPVEKDLGAPYAFNPTTGMLETPGGGISGAVETRARFVEGGPGGFRRVPETPADAGGGGGWAARRAAAAAAAAQRGAGDGSMRAAVFAAQSVVVAAGLFAQGLLAGVACVNLFMTYFLDAANLTSVTENSGFLHYYSPIAVNCQRLYVTLSAIALLASVDKYSRDALSGFNLQGFQLQKVDFLGCLSFFMAFVCSIVAVPFEDTLYYANARVPSWWTTASASGAFVSKLSSYHGVNAARAVFALLGYACVCATATPASLDVVQRAEELAKGAPNHFSSRSLGDGGSEGRGQQRERAGDFGVPGGGFERSDRRKFGGSIRNDVKQTSTPAMTTTFR